MATNDEILRAFQKNASAIHQLEQLTETIQAKLGTLEAENKNLTEELASYRQCSSCSESMIPQTTCDTCQRLWES